jgi:radical SAM protein with 4Fe4S-binding SPASM domain
VPKISKAAPYIHKCLEIGKREKIPHWHIRYVPLCYFQDYLDQISELQEVSTFHSEHLAPDFQNMNAEQGRQNLARQKTERCQGCKLYNICEGLWKEYIKNYSDKELIPISDKK